MDPKETTSLIIDMSAFKRLIREVMRISDLSGGGIYYKQDPHILTRGIALIIGPTDSIYANCPLFFQFDFPSDYPFNPPKVKFLTNDGKTRFHPNLYIDGKVCLSILGTFSGPSWQSTMSFSMVLLSLKALLDTNPLRHEPGYENVSMDHNYAKHYSEYVNFRIVKCALKEYKDPTYLRLFENDLKDILPELQQNLKVFIQKQAAANIDDYYPYIPYGMEGSTEWKKLMS